MLDPGTHVNKRYLVKGMLGGGTFKQVFLVEDSVLANRRCALAVMVDSFMTIEERQKATSDFRREADILANLDHEHIPKVYDRFTEDNRHHLVMEFVDGETLEQRLKEAGGKLDEPIVIDVAIQVLDTLVYLQSQNPPFIHRDLKPSNVMLTWAGRIKLIDFGVARHFMPQQPGTGIGTVGYAPPEQYQGKAEPRSDLYALGVIMHRALSGRDPLLDPFNFPKLVELIPDIHPQLSKLIEDALQKEPAARPADAAEFRRRLLDVPMRASATTRLQSAAEPAARTAPTSLGVAPSTARLGNPLMIGIGATVLAVAVLLTILLTRRGVSTPAAHATAAASVAATAIGTPAPSISPSPSPTPAVAACHPGQLEKTIRDRLALDAILSQYKIGVNVDDNCDVYLRGSGNPSSDDLRRLEKRVKQYRRVHSVYFNGKEL